MNICLLSLICPYNRAWVYFMLNSSCLHSLDNYLVITGSNIYYMDSFLSPSGLKYNMIVSDGESIACITFFVYNSLRMLWPGLQNDYYREWVDRMTIPIRFHELECNMIANMVIIGSNIYYMNNILSPSDLKYNMYIRRWDCCLYILIYTLFLTWPGVQI